MRIIFCLLLTTFLFASTSWATTLTLPNPAVYPNAHPYDNFYSYAAGVIDQIGYHGFYEPTGSGNPDLKILTGGNTNNPTPFNNAAQFDASAGSFSGSWGIAVDDILGFLHTNNANNNIPVFTFDFSEPASADGFILFLAHVEVMNGLTQIAEWSLDSTANNQFDPSSPIYVPSGVMLPYPWNSNNYLVQPYSSISGRPDFLLYSPTMLLSSYAGLGYTFNISYYLAGLDAESTAELYLSGNYVPPVPTPEPAALALMAFGIPMIWLARRNFRKS